MKITYVIYELKEEIETFGNNNIGGKFPFPRPISTKFFKKISFTERELAEEWTQMNSGKYIIHKVYEKED